MVDGLSRALTRRSALCLAAKATALCASSWLAGCSDPAGGVPGGAGAAGAGPSAEPPKRLPKSVAGIVLPDSALALAAASLCFSASPELLYNHCLRSYVFAGLLFKKLGKSYDRELAFVGAVLHDLGLLDAYMSPTARFEIDGADAAMKFLREHRVPQKRAEIVWDAIALHTNLAIAERKAPEIAMVSLGAIMDAAGLNLDQLAAEDVASVLSAYPRLGFKRAAIQTMISLCEKKPFAQLLHPFAEVGRRHIPNFVSPTIEDLMLLAPFPE
jgi:hypothetical protein